MTKPHTLCQIALSGAVHLALTREYNPATHRGRIVKDTTAQGMRLNRLLN